MAAAERSASTSHLPEPRIRIRSSTTYPDERSQEHQSSTTSVHFGSYSQSIGQPENLRNNHAHGTPSRNSRQAQLGHLLHNADADLETYGINELRDGFFDATYYRPMPPNRPELIRKASETLPLALQAHHPLSFKYFVPQQWEEFNGFFRQVITTRSAVGWKKIFDYGVPWVLGQAIALLISCIVVPDSGSRSLTLSFHEALETIGRGLVFPRQGNLLLRRDLAWHFIRLSTAVRDFTIEMSITRFEPEDVRLVRNLMQSVIRALLAIDPDTKLFDIQSNNVEEGNLEADTIQRRPVAENKEELMKLHEILCLVATRLASPTKALVQAMIVCTTSCDDALITLGGQRHSLHPTHAPKDLSQSLRALSTAITTFEGADLALMTDPRLPPAASTYREVVSLFLFIHPLRQAAGKVQALSEKVLDMQQRRRSWTLQLPSYPLHKQFDRINAQVRHDRGGLTAGFYFLAKMQLEQTMGNLQSRSFVPSHQPDNVPSLSQTGASASVVQEKSTDLTRHLAMSGKRAFRYKVWELLHRMQGFESRFAFKVVLVTTLLSVPAWLEQSRSWWNDFGVWWTVVTVWLMTHPRVSGTLQDLAARLFCVALGAVWGGLAFAAGDGNLYVMAVFAAVFMLPMMHRYTQSAHPRSGLIGCISFTVISLSTIADDVQLSATTVAWTRGLAFAVAIFASILTNWVMWPFVARHELKKSLAAMMLHLAILYRGVVSRYIYYAEEQAPNAQDIQRSEMLEGRLREGFVRIRQLLELTRHEIRLRAPFDPLPYSALIEACERFFEHVVEVRQSSFYFQPSLRVNTGEVNDSLVPYRRDAVAVILMNLYILASALRANQPIPQYMPSAAAARKKLVDRMEELEVSQTHETESTRRERKRWADVYRYAFASALTNIVEHLNGSLPRSHFWRDMSVDRPARASSSFHFVAGLSTGILSASLLQPADLLKTRVQQARSTTLLHTFRDITSGPNSLRQLWRGTLPSVIRTGFGSALYFSTLNALRQHVFRSNLLTPTGLGSVSQTASRSSSSSSLPQLSNLANLTTGAVARASAGLIMMPITVIKVRFESNFYSYQSLAGAASAIFKNEGFKGFFAGFGATAIRDAPYAGLYVVFYEQSKGYLSKVKDATALGNKSVVSEMKNSSAISINFVSGVLAAGLATAITNPFDAVKTRLQLMPGKYANMVQASRQMVREEGFRSLFDGLGLRAGRKALSSALAWTVYEELVRRAEKRWVETEGTL
ncbi:MAG: hypothetical protein Q9171_007508 [Xanthocarpia ochracea]